MSTLTADPLRIGVMLEELRRRDADMRSIPEEMSGPMSQIGALLDCVNRLTAASRPGPNAPPSMPKSVQRLVMNLQTHDLFSQRMSHIYPVFSIIWKTVDNDASHKAGRPGPPSPKVLPLLCQATSLASSLLCATRMELDRSLAQIREALGEIAAIVERSGGMPVNIESPLISLDLLETRIRSAEFVLDQLHQALRVAVPSEEDQDFFIELPEGEFDDLLSNYSMSSEHSIHRDELGSGPLPGKTVDPGEVVLF